MVEYANAKPRPRLSLTALAGPGFELPARLPHYGVFVPHQELHTQVNDNKGHFHGFRKAISLSSRFCQYGLLCLENSSTPFHFWESLSQDPTGDSPESLSQAPLTGLGPCAGLLDILLPFVPTQPSPSQTSC